MIFRFALFTILFCSTVHTVQAEKIGPYSIGEQLNYTLHWGLFHVGDSQFKTSLTQTEDGAEEICVEFSSKSRGLANTLYPVDSETKVFINPTTFKTHRVERKINEGDYFKESTLTFNYDSMQVRWENHTEDEIHDYELPPDTTDFYSLLYRLREGLEAGQTSKTARVAVDENIHDLRVLIDGEDELSTKGQGKKICTRLRVEALTEGLFVNKIPEEVWVSKTEPKRVERMNVRVSLGKVSVRYKPQQIRDH